MFDYQPGDVFGCVADIGWITGHSYVVYGPLCNGATTVLFESTPVYPDAGEDQELWVVGEGSQGWNKELQKPGGWYLARGQFLCPIDQMPGRHWRC